MVTDVRVEKQTTTAAAKSVSTIVFMFEERKGSKNLRTILDTTTQVSVPGSFSASRLIHTGLQPGAGTRHYGRNRFNGFSPLLDGNR